MNSQKKPITAMIPTAAAPIAIPAVVPADRPSSELLFPLVPPEDPELDDPLLPPAVSAAPVVVAVTSDDLYSSATRSAETVNAASPETDTVVESTFTHARETGVLGPKVKATVEEGHSDRPLMIMVSSPWVTVPSHHVE